MAKRQLPFLFLAFRSATTDASVKRLFPRFESAIGEFKWVQVSSAVETTRLMERAEAGVLFVEVMRGADAVQILTALKTLRERIDSHQVIVVAHCTIRSPELVEALRKEGCSEIISDESPLKALTVIRAFRFSHLGNVSALGLKFLEAQWLENASQEEVAELIQAATGNGSG